MEVDQREVGRIRSYSDKGIVAVWSVEDAKVVGMKMLSVVGLRAGDARGAGASTRVADANVLCSGDNRLDAWP